jgi:hypothetical protein
MQDIECLGIDFRCVTWQLQNEGIQKFIEPYDALMQTLAVRHQQLLSEHVGAQTTATSRAHTAAK